MTASGSLSAARAGGTLRTVPRTLDLPVAERFAAEADRVRRAVGRRLTLAAAVTVVLAAASVVALVAGARAAAWVGPLRAGAASVAVPAHLDVHVRTDGRTSTNWYTLVLDLPGRAVSFDHVDPTPYAGTTTVEVWVDPSRPDRVATRWDAADTGHRRTLHLLATGGLVATLLAAWWLRTWTLAAWLVRRHGLDAGYVLDARTFTGLPAQASRTLVRAHGEDEVYATGGFRRSPTSGWATLSGPARWRVLADWGRRPQLVRRSWSARTAERWRRAFDTPAPEPQPCA